MKQLTKILFVYDHEKPEYWMDGLREALRLLEKKYEIQYWNRNELPSGYTKPDFILGWGAFGSRVDTFLQQLPEKKGLCIAGNTNPPTGADNYDVLFYETKWYREQIKFFPNIVQAFGVNKTIYKPIYKTKVFDYLGAGCLAKWKRWDKMLNKEGKRIVIGDYQRNNEAESSEIALNLLKGGVIVSDQMRPTDLVEFMNMAHTIYVPSDVYGGGERLVLEAKACGLNVEVEDDNPKLKELVDLEVIPDQVFYAERLIEGIESVL